MNLVVPKQKQGHRQSDYDQLVEESLNGSSTALEKLCELMRPLIYNLCLKMVLYPPEAEDLTQEILIKMVTKLSQFDSSKASLTTWVYTITRNTIFDQKPGKLESGMTSLEVHGQELDNILDQDFKAQTPEEKLLVKEANVGCLLGMILCLERQQRLVFILGEIMGVDSKVGSKITGHSPENFRQKLSRARKDIYNFMNEKCGLVNKENPCRCHKKTQGFIKAGWVNPENIQFADHHYKNAKIFSEEYAPELADFEKENRQILQNLPDYDTTEKVKLLEALLSNKEIKEQFRL